VDVTYRIGKRCDRCRISYIQAVTTDAHAVGRNQRRSVLQSRLVDIYQGKMATPPRQRHSDGSPDAARCAGDDCRPIRKTHSLRHYRSSRTICMRG
jgi:hypothetical protein